MIRELRKCKNMTQAELAEKCGITQAYISMIEKNKVRNLSISVLFEIANALDVPLATLITEYVGGKDENHIA